MEATTYKQALRKRMKIMIIALVVFFGLIFGYNGLRYFMMKQYFAHYQPPPISISTAKAVTETWHPSLKSVGSLIAVNGVDVAPEVSGIVSQIYFKSGEYVKAGEPLIQLSDRTDKQDLKNFEAQLTLAQITYDRTKKLFNSRAASQSDLDSAKAQLDEAEAQVDKTKIMIDKKHIEAPFDGKIGIRMVNLGQYVEPGTALVNLQSLDPLYVQFYLPEQDLKYLHLDQLVRVTIDTYGKEKFQGKITAVNSQVDAQTRNILVQATLPNPKHILYPGMFANVEIILPQQKNVITLPQTAINYNLFGDSVFVVKQDGKDKKGNPILRAHLEYVTVGERQGDKVAILNGIKAGDEIVSSGQLKLQDKMQVVINNSVHLTSRDMTQQND